jgi:hypothetical protein
MTEQSAWSLNVGEESILDEWSDLVLNDIQKIRCLAEWTRRRFAIRTRWDIVNTILSLRCKISVSSLVEYTCFVGVADCDEDDVGLVCEFETASYVGCCKEVGIPVDDVSAFYK